MALELGGKTRGLKFNIGTLKYLKEVTGIDPMDFKVESNRFDELLPYATSILHAALLSNCLSKREDPDFSADDIKVWVNELSVGDLTEVIYMYNGIFAVSKPSVNGEVDKDTQLANL